MKCSSHAVTGADRLTEQFEQLNRLEEVPHKEASSVDKSNSTLSSCNVEREGTEEFFDVASNSSAGSDFCSARAATTPVDSSTSPSRC